LLRKSEELKQNNLAHIEGKDLGPKGSSLNKDGSTIAFSSTFPSNYQRTGLDGLQKGGKRGLLNKAVTFSLPFDEYLDRVSGTESIASNYPSYKIDKRLM